MDRVRSLWARVSDELAMLAIAVVAVLLVYGFLTADGEGRDRLAGIVNALGIAIAVTIVYLTYHSVRAARESAKASRDAVEEMRAARQPYVVAYPSVIGYILAVVVENTGSAPAWDVRLLNRGDREWLKVNTGEPIVAIAFLAAGARFAHTIDYLTMGMNEERFQPVDATAVWEDDRQNTQSIDLTLEPWPHITAARETSLQDVVRAIESVSRDIKDALRRR
jgi:hypothetical protein